MGLLIIDSKKENLERYKKLFKEDNNHYVNGLNDSLMLLETVFEFDLAICNYNLEDATGKDLHENFRMLPETENVPILFILERNDDATEEKIKKMSLADYLISPDDDTLLTKVDKILNDEEITQVVNVDEFSEETTAVVNNQFDFDSLVNDVNNNGKEDDNQVDFDSLMNEINTNTEVREDDLNNENITSDIHKLNRDTRFFGDITTTPISEVLMHILDNDYTVEIILKNELSEEECIIRIKDKNIVDIEMEDFDVEDALFWVLNWDIANIEVSIIDDISEENCEIPIEEIIQEVINKRSEFDELSETLPDLDTILVQTPSYDSALSDLETEYKNIIELFDGTNTINDVISLINEDNIYVLTIISQLYMDEILILPEEENNVNQEKLIVEEITDSEETIESSNNEEEDSEDDNLLSDYLTEESDDLNLNTEVLESDDSFEELNKEEYINNLVESFKEEEEIIIKPKASPFRIALLVLFFINMFLTILIFVYKKAPQKIIINNIDRQEKIIKKIDLYNLGLENKIDYIKNEVNIVNDVLKQKILKQKKELKYKKIFNDRKLNIQLKRANFFMLKGNYKKAISIYKKILELIPNQPDILLKLATAYYNDNNNDKAVKIIDKLDFLKYDDVNFIFLKAQVYQAVNDLQKSYNYYQKFLLRSDDEKLKKDIKVILKNIYKNTKIVQEQP